MNMLHLLIEDLLGEIDGADDGRIRELLAELRVQDIAALLMELDDTALRRVYPLVGEDSRVEVFSYLEPPYQVLLLETMSPAELRGTLARLPPDDLTELLESLPTQELSKLLRLLPPASLRRAVILLGYPEDSVGRRMTPAVITISPRQTAADALESVRAQSSVSESINVIFVVDEDGVLQASLPIKDLILAQPRQRILELFDGEPVSVRADQPQETAAQLIQHYDIDALPVVDEVGRLLGMVTVDDALDVVEEEATEDFHKMGSVGQLDLSLRDAPLSLLYRARVGWLLVLVAVNILSGAAISVFEGAIEALVVLVFFLPLIIASGGNAGAQSATLMVRALATGDVQASDWLKMWGRELFVAIALGATMGLAVSLIGYWRGGPDVASVVAISMVLVVVMGALIGMLLPFLLTRFRMDPATASAPLITSIADVAGILIYFTVATLLLDVPRAFG